MDKRTALRPQVIPARVVASVCALVAAGCAHVGGSHVPVERVAPRAEDVGSIDGILRAFYEVVNVDPAAPRQWSRDRTLYTEEIRFYGLGRSLDVYDHQRLVDETEPMVQAGFHERELRREVRRYGNIAHVFSTYETLHGSGARERGVNSLELYWDGQRWWISAVSWQAETGQWPLPAWLLTAPAP